MVVDDGFTVAAPGLRGAKLVNEASTFVWESPDFIVDDEATAPKSARGMRWELTKAMQMVLGAPAADAVAARYRVRVVEASDSGVLFYAPCLVLFTVFGCPASLNSAKVAVELQVGDRLYQAEGEGSVIGFFYYPGTAEGFWVTSASSFAEALVDALRKIDVQAQQGSGKQVAAATEVAP